MASPRLRCTVPILLALALASGISPASGRRPLERSYGFGGVALAGFTTSARGNDVAVRRDGSAFVAGHVLRPGSTSADLAIARFTARGFPDPRFGSNGRATVRFEEGTPNDSVAAPTGMVLLLGPRRSVTVVATQVTRTPTRSCCARIVAARLTNEGRLDTRFGQGGRLLVDPIPVQGNAEYLAGAGLSEDGSLVVAGNIEGAAAFLARFRPDGSPDPAFGANGVAVVGSPTMLVINDIGLDRRGRVTAAGVGVGASGSLQLSVCRFTRGGTADTAFGSGGCAITPTGAATLAADALTIHDGAAYIAGRIGSPTQRWDVARVDPSGAFDDAFGRSGLASVNVRADSFITGLVMGEGLLWMVGVRLDCYPDYCIVEGGLVARVTARGAPDRTFGSRGSASLPAHVDSAWGIAPHGRDAVVAVTSTLLGRPDAGAAKIRG